MRRPLFWPVVLCIPIALTACNVHLLATEAFVRWEYSRDGFPTAPGIAEDERLALAVPSTRFVANLAEASTLRALAHDGRPLYTAAEIDHLLDVRRLVRALSGLGLLAALVVAAAAVSWSRGRDRADLAAAIRAGGWLGVAVVVLVAAGVTIAWPLVFTGFHEVLFPPGTWQFPADSGLIRLFPERFWYDGAVALLGLTVLEGLALVLVGRRLPRRA